MMSRKKSNERKTENGKGDDDNNDRRNDNSETDKAKYELKGKQEREGM